MNHPNKWKDFLTPLLAIGGFAPKNPTFKGETESVTYRTHDENSELEIRVGYLSEDLLIYLTIYDPRIPGYNTYCEGDYFHQYDFHDSKTYGNPGLEFEEINKEGIKDLLRSGLEGSEIQFIKDGTLLKSKVNLVNEEFYSSFYFYQRSLWQKLFGENIESKAGVVRKEINLNEIFSGIKDI